MGVVWYTGNRVGKLGRLDPKTGQIREFAMPPEARDPHTPLIRDGMVWFTSQQSDVYGRFDPATGKAQVWKVPTARALPYGMVNAPDGSIWIALFGTNKLGHIDPATGSLREFSLPEAGARPRRLVVASDGVVWYTDFRRGRLGSYNPRDGAAKEFPSPGGESSGPYGIAIAPDGRIFYDEAGTSTIIVFDRKTAKMETVKIPTNGSIVRNISVDSARGRVWLALSGIGRIGKIDLK
jgi:Streptogramin lyase